MPAGTTFENACMNDRWHVGFTSVVTPALGVTDDCTWTCGGGISKTTSRVFAEDGVLKFDYRPAGVLLIVR